MKGRKRERGGQIIVVTAIIITIIVLSIAYMISEAVNLRQSIRYEPYKEVVENIESSFRAALAATLANMTYYVDQQGWDVERARSFAYNYLSKWKAAAMRAYADLGLELDFTTTLDESSAYLFQDGKTIPYPGTYEEEIAPWKIFDLSQVYWDYSTGCSAINATLYVNLTEYGFYGWRHPVFVASNATIDPESIAIKDKAPADIVLVLDASDSMFFQPYGSVQDKNDYTMQLTGSIPNSPDWQTVGSIDLGEIPTQFVAVLTGDPGLDIQLVSGSVNPQLLISYGENPPLSLQAIEDSFVSEKNPIVNYGTSQTLEVSGDIGDLYRTWLKFDISSIPSGFTKAQLNLYIVYNPNPQGGKDYVLKHSYDDSWTESGITWNNKPESFSSTHSASAPKTEKGWISWDVTSDLQQDYNEKPSISWSVQDSKEKRGNSRLILICSRESPGIPGYNYLDDSSSQNLVYSSGSTDPVTIQGTDFGIVNMQTYGKSGKWIIQLKNLGTECSYTVQVQTRKLDQVRNAVTRFLSLLNPSKDRVAIVQYGPGSYRSGVYYYYAKTISSGGLSNDFQAALDDINWREPHNPGDIGYGFEMIGSDYYFGGKKPLGKGVEVGSNLFSGAREGSQRIMIIISGGKEDIRPYPDPPDPELHGELYYPTPEVSDSYYTISKYLTGKAYEDYKVITYTIGYGEGADEYSLRELARLGHGQYYHATNGPELSKALSSLAYQLNDLTFDFTLTQEYGIAVNTLTESSITAYLVDEKYQRHEAYLSDFYYRGGGKFSLTLSLAGWQLPEAVEVVVRDPRGIIVRLCLPLWRVG